MTKLTDKTHYAVGIGIITGIIIFSMSVLFKQEPTPTFTETKTAVEEVYYEDISELDIDVDFDECVEIIEYNMTTGEKTLIDCISKEN